MTCARRPAGARYPAPPTSARSPRTPDARTGRALARALSLLASGLAQAQETVAVSNHAKTKYRGLFTSTHVLAQGFTTGSVAGGYALTSIATKYGPDRVFLALSRLRAQLWWSAATGGDPGTKLADLTIPSSAPPGTVSFAAPGTPLDANTKYYFVIYTTTIEYANLFNFPVHSTKSTGEDSGGLAGWSIEDISYYQLEDNAPGSTWTKDTTEVLQLRVNAPAAPSEPRNVTIASGDDEVTVTWDVPTSWGNWNAAGYYFEVLGNDSWTGVGVLSNPAATTHTVVRGVYRNLPEVANGDEVKLSIVALICAIHEDSRGTYGMPRMHSRSGWPGDGGLAANGWHG